MPADSADSAWPRPGSSGVVSAVRNRAGEMSMALVDTSTGSVRYLLPFSSQTVGYPSVRGDTIWFTASRNGQDNARLTPPDAANHRFLPSTLDHTPPPSGSSVAIRLPPPNT